MANPKFCYPNWLLPTTVVTPTITGAGWVDLAKLRGEVLSEMARYPGVNPANTKLSVDLGVIRNIRVLVLPFHNAKPGDTARIRIADDPAFASVVLDTGSREFFGEVYPFGTLPWGHAQWLDGRYTQEQAAELMPPWIFIAAEDVLGRYLEIELDFSGNSDGYVDLGQVVASPAFTPVYNMNYGVAPPFYRDQSTKNRSKGGAVFSEKNRPYLSTKMQLNWISTDELYGNFYEMVQQYGITTPFFFIYNSDDNPVLMPKRSFMATAETFSDPANTSHNWNSLSIELSQVF